MAVQGSGFFTRSSMPMREVHFRQTTSAGRQQTSFRFGLVNRKSDGSGALQPLRVLALNLNDADSGKKSTSSPVPNSNYVVPWDKSTCIIRPLGEILQDLHKRIPDNIIVKPDYHSDDGHSTFIPWYHANRMLSFYAPGWCGEIRDVIFSDNGNVMVVYRVTIRGLDGEEHRESTGTVSSHNVDIADPVSAAEEIAFCRACARFGLGLYLYNKE